MRRPLLHVNDQPHGSTTVRSSGSGSSPRPCRTAGLPSISVESAIVDPLQFELFGSKPANGFVTEDPAPLARSWFRYGAVVRYCICVAFRFCAETGRCRP